MPVIFVGGARGSGKTTLIKALKERVPHVEHVMLAQEVNRIMPAEKFHDDYVGMRRLTPEQQYEAVSKVIKKIADDVKKENSSRIVFIDGHYVSSSYIDNHESFIPCLRENAKLFDKMIWVKIEPHEIIHRRFIRECIPRPLDLTIREYLAEGIEARFLERNYGTQLVICRDDEFFSAVYDDFADYMKRPVEREHLPLQRQVEVVLRLIRGEDPGALAQESGVTPATLSEWQQQFVVAGSKGLNGHGPDDRDRQIAREIARLKAIVREMTISAGDSRRAEQNSQPGLDLPMEKQRSSGSLFSGAGHSNLFPGRKDS